MLANAQFQLTNMKHRVQHLLTYILSFAFEVLYCDDLLALFFFTVVPMVCSGAFIFKLFPLLLLHRFITKPYNMLWVFFFSVFA